MKNTCFVVLLMLTTEAFAQSTSFEVVGKACHYNDKKIIVEKVLFRDSTYASACRINNVQPEMPLNFLSVDACTFSFNGEISIPTPFSAVCPDDEPANESAIFFVEAGITEISFGNLTDSVGVLSTNSANKELDKITKVLGTHSFRFLEPIQVEKNLSLLKPYIKAHPDSYVAMWLIIIMVGSYCKLG